MTKQTLTVLAMIAAAMTPLLLGGCQQPDYSHLDPQTRAALVSGLLANIGQNNAAMQQNPFAGPMYQPAFAAPRMTCVRQPLGLIPSLTCN